MAPEAEGKEEEKKGVARAIRQNIDLFVLGLLLPAAVIGSYGVARRIMDSSFLSIDAMNRLIYPHFALTSRVRIQDAMPDAGRAFLAALLIGTGTAAAIFVAAPYLPLVFGRNYHDLTFFLRALSGLIVVVAGWSIAIDLLGASGHQGERAFVVNTVNLVGSFGIAAASWIAAPSGTFVALYATEIATAIAAWVVLVVVVRRTGAAPLVKPA